MTELRLKVEVMGASEVVIILARTGLDLDVAFQPRLCFLVVAWEERRIGRIRGVTSQLISFVPFAEAFWKTAFLMSPGRGTMLAS